jgi:hypothetical protein
MRKTSFIILLIGLILCSFNAYSQGGSNYTIYGIGDIYQTVDAEYLGVGGTSIAFPSNHGINSSNPAMWSYNSSTRLQAGYLFNQHVVDQSKSQIWQNNGKVSGVQALFAVDTSIGLSFTLGLIPYTMVNYYINMPVTAEVDNSLSLTGNTLYQGSGGLSRGFLGFGTKIFNNLSIGISANATFGVISNSTYTIFNDITYTSYGSTNEQVDYIKGWGYKLGIAYSPFSKFTFGAMYENHSVLDVSRNIHYQSALTLDTTFSDNSKITLPSTIGVGFSYSIGRFIFAADYLYHDFKNFSYHPNPLVTFRNGRQISAGLSYLGNPAYSSVYADKVTYNLGFGYKELYYTVSGQDINEYFASIGGGFPVVGTVILDAALTVGQRGTMSNNLIKEWYARLSFNLSIGETWFKPFKREY